MRMGLAVAIFNALAAMALAATSLRAQSMPVEWTAVSRIESGGCESGGVVDVLEHEGSMRLRFRINEMRVVEVILDLAVDGSSRGEFHGKPSHSFANIGRTVRNEHDTDENRGVFKHEIVNVPPGSGKRPLESRQSRGSGECHWIWMPK